MVLVDTSIWVDHLRSGDAVLSLLLEDTRAVIHPYVIGELACANLHNRTQVLRLLSALPKTPAVRDSVPGFAAGCAIVPRDSNIR